MKNILALILFCLANVLWAQYSISGKFSPPQDFKYILAYELTPGGQKYVGDATVNKGHFTLEMPEKSSAGTYRLVYAVPQDEYYLDILYNGKENIEFDFSLETGLMFQKSKENIIFDQYFKKINEAESKLLDFYKDENASESTYLNLAQELSNIQSQYENHQGIPLALKFIQANRPYIPKAYEDANTFFIHKNEHYFDRLSFDNPLLQASDYLRDKLTYYAFSAVPLSVTTKKELEKQIQQNLMTIANKIKDTPEAFQIKVFYHLWKVADDNAFTNTSDHVYNIYLKQLAITTGRQELTQEIETSMRLRVGAISPDITWSKNGKKVSLLSLEGAKHYVLVFWSSTCSHCLKELPELHKELKNKPNTTVVAIGLEDQETNWKIETAKLPGFEHAIALNKWESTHAKIFAIQQTPTYFILDSEKRFIAKPENHTEVSSFLKDQY